MHSVERLILCECHVENQNDLINAEIYDEHITVTATTANVSGSYQTANMFNKIANLNC